MESCHVYHKLVISLRDERTYELENIKQAVVILDPVCVCVRFNAVFKDKVYCNWTLGTVNSASLLVV